MSGSIHSGRGDELDREQAIRREELDRVRGLLPTTGSVLELGGGSGWQAALMERSGMFVVSVDLPGRDRIARHHTVVDYDGHRLPLPDASVDAVFSSNVLEHVEQLDELLVETARVIRPGGRAVHVVPTPVWRFWTGIAHPIQAVLSLPRRVRRPPARANIGRSDNRGSLVPAGVRSDSRRYMVSRLMTSGPHGNAPSAWAELAQWQDDAWRRRLVAGGAWQVVEVMQLGLFYTGYGLLKDLDLRSRCRLARVLGSSTRAYILRRADAPMYGASLDQQ